MPLQPSIQKSMVVPRPLVDQVSQFSFANLLFLIEHAACQPRSRLQQTRSPEVLEQKNRCRRLSPLACRACRARGLPRFVLDGPSLRTESFAFGPEIFRHALIPGQGQNKDGTKGRIFFPTRAMFQVRDLRHTAGWPMAEALVAWKAVGTALGKTRQAGCCLGHFSKSACELSVPKVRFGRASRAVPHAANGSLRSSRRRMPYPGWSR